MATLVFGVLRKQQDTTLLCTMFTIGGFLIAGLLVLTRTAGFGFNGQYVADPFSAFNQILILSGGALCSILALDWNRVTGYRAVRVPGADAVLHHRHDDHGIGRQPDVAVSGAGVAIARALRPGVVRPRRCAVFGSRA